MARLLACCLALLATLALGTQPPLSAQQPPRPQILSRLTWFDRSGMRLGGIGPVADHGNLELSPDGTRVAVAVTDHTLETRDIWIYDAKSGDRTRFTSEPGDENWLIWSGDGQRVVLNSFGREHLDLPLAEEGRGIRLGALLLHPQDDVRVRRLGQAGQLFERVFRIEVSGRILEEADQGGAFSH